MRMKQTDNVYWFLQIALDYRCFPKCKQRLSLLFRHLFIWISFPMCLHIYLYLLFRYISHDNYLSTWHSTNHKSSILMMKNYCLITNIKIYFMLQFTVFFERFYGSSHYCSYIFLCCPMIKFMFSSSHQFYSQNLVLKEISS